jgi:hypothetical protein
MDDTTRELDDRILDLILHSDIDETDDPRFEPLALDLFRYQYERCRPYQQMCEDLGRHPDDISSWWEIPPVPTVAFKETSITTCGPGPHEWELWTSGTSSQGTTRGIVVRDQTSNELCEAAQRRSHKEFVLPDMDSVAFLSLAPIPELLPHAGVSHCMAMLSRSHGSDGSESFFGERGPDFGRFASRLHQSEQEGEIVAIHGATFSMVHFFEWCADNGETFQLAPGSRLNHGSGYKGRSRVLTPEEFGQQATDVLGLPASHLVNVLGMTELGSQYYDDLLRRTTTGAPPRPTRMANTPWLRARVVNPVTLERVPTGTVGALMHWDLSLRGNVCVVLSEDLGMEVEDGFDILGRPEEAEARGCSLSLEEFFGASSPLGTRP